MRQLRFFLPVVAILFLLAGCNTYMTSPGPVTKDAQKQSEQNRIVTFTVKGKGVEPESALTKGQARIMAERAAVADGYRQFVEKLKGVYVEAMMSAGYATVDQDYIKTQTRSILRGVEIEEVTHGDYGIAEAVMSLRVHFTRQGIIWWPKGLGPKAKVGYDTASR
jgi:hypothetical protein